MRTGLIGAVMLSASASSASIDAAHAVPPSDVANLEGEGAAGARGVKVAGVMPSPFLGDPDMRQSPLATVGEGGEGGRGRKWRQRSRDRDRFHYGRRHDRNYGYSRRDYDRYYERPFYDRPYYRPY
jgi:hypothetical protein